jgi:xanthine/CO dehydrogenase XdhC/CoxF family maturation factor
MMLFLEAQLPNPRFWEHHATRHYDKPYLEAQDTLESGANINNSRIQLCGIQFRAKHFFFALLHHIRQDFPVALRLLLQESALSAVMTVNHSTECHPEDKNFPCIILCQY